MKNKKHSSRRKFLSKVPLGLAAISAPGILYGRNTHRIIEMTPKTWEEKRYTSNDQVNLATIGIGIQGIYDTQSALTVDGVKLVAVCDLYTGRLARAKELFGDDLFTTRDYREILNRDDVDAVIVATPDHWHETIATDALKAGKGVYLEKPMIQNIDEGHNLIKAENSTGKVVQIGSQGMSSLGNEKARELYLGGAIGELLMVEVFNDRYSSEGAWQYPIPPDANPDTVDFDTFLGKAPKVKYDPKRFFRWRNYQDYGTGVAGDLFVHSFSTLHHVIDSFGPVKASSTGGIRYWKDGRDVPDLMLTLYDYPKAETHSEFNAILRINFTAGNGGGGGFRLIGTDGEMSVGQNRVTVRHSRMGYRPGAYSLIAYTQEMQEKINAEYDKYYEGLRDKMMRPEETVFEAPRNYKGGHHDHFQNFFTAVRGGKPVKENTTYGLRAAGAALLSNFSYFENRVVKWDPVAMKLV